MSQVASFSCAFGHGARALVGRAHKPLAAVFTAATVNEQTLSLNQAGEIWLCNQPALVNALEAFLGGDLTAAGAAVVALNAPTEGFWERAEVSFRRGWVKLITPDGTTFIIQNAGDGKGAFRIIFPPRVNVMRLQEIFDANPGVRWEIEAVDVKAA